MHSLSAQYLLIIRIVVDDEGDGNGEDSMPKIVGRKRLSLEDLTLPDSSCNILAVLVLSPHTSVNFPKFFQMLFGPRVLGSVVGRAI